MALDNISSNPECEIVTTRIVQFPIELAYSAWTEPEHLKNWWGPKGFTNTFNEFDLRPGGKWSFIMHGPDKGNYANECEFLKVEKPSFLSWKRYSKPLFQVAVSFEPVSGNSTKIVFKMIFDTSEECNKLKPFVVDKNEENLISLKLNCQKWFDFLPNDKSCKINFY
ncbi:SRPBCC family protein [Flavobacterium limi]|uniref:Activator of HSP90 ATPase n=1 Tax=Flavobacterium limi TaxID=2045105 RepID=A0ABQ1UJS2_9FLAO|nr:SRPBCC family protein [Flavobacterium limi]GGF19875.1 activator of HSP90 ATPase [Flavobacterium limi]